MSHKPQITHQHFADDLDEQVDPHGFDKGHHHGHVIMPVFTLRTVLALLLFFTFMTVGLAQLEKAAAAYFGVVLPGWVNVAVAMSIATIKSLIVAGYFMQLKYDNPLNSVIMLFCVFALSLFLGFTAIDLGLRGTVYPYKAGEITAGGTGNVTRTEIVDGKPVKVTVSKALYQFAADQFLEKVGPKRFEEIKAAVAHGHGPHEDHGPTSNSPNASRPRSGTTPGLFDDKAAETAGEHSGGGHGAAH